MSKKVTEELDVTKPESVIKYCDNLKGSWSKRDKKMKEWYKFLKLEDKLEQDDMESVVSNDPKTGFNMAVHLLTTATIAHKVDISEMGEVNIAAVSYLESYLTKQWYKLNRKYRKAGRQGILRSMASTMLATGWLAVYTQVTDESIEIINWSPVECYPVYDIEDGLVEHAHIFKVDASTANRKWLKLTGSPRQEKFKSDQMVYDFWCFDDTGTPTNMVIIGREFAKPATAHPEYTELPVSIGPAAGLPDMGSLDSNWTERFGEALVGPSESVFDNYNRLLTFCQQLIHDTANTKWLELSEGDTPILRQEEMFKRGAIFRGAPGDSVTALGANPIPVELTQMKLDYQNMIQRGMFPWSIYGNMQVAMTGYTMSQVASAAMQVLTPYKDCLSGVMEDSDNFIVQVLVNNNYHPYDFKRPKDLPEYFDFVVDYSIEIPGYLVHRATVARMLAPTFELDAATVMDRLFPEIRNPMKELANARRTKALNNPEAIAADTIIAFREHANALRQMKMPDAAKVYETLANNMEQQLGMQQKNQPTRPMMEDNQNQAANRNIEQMGTMPDVQ